MKNRSKIVDFTQPYIETGLVVVVRANEIESNPWAFLRPFSPGMWCTTGAFFLIMGAVVWIVEHRVNTEFRGPPQRQVSNVLWYVHCHLFLCNYNLSSFV